ncbi:MAG TPA: cysteine peptidase family C39 domain-containing protein, partial [Chitinophagaceae bacterium]|nr:cysteine peptidase family C39 domain-containing protein [Chitinophagaceae bacterium]
MLKKFPCDRQMDMNDCGPASLKMIARYYGKYYSLQFLRDRCGITREGISFLDLSYASESIGIRSKSLKCTIDDLLNKIPLPAIIHWDNSHFIVVYKTNPKREIIYVSDPAKGRVAYTKEQFAKHWVKKKEGHGALLAVEPQAEFYERRAEEKTGRKKTMENFIGYFRPFKKSFVNLIIVMLVV